MKKYFNKIYILIVSVAFFPTVTFSQSKWISCKNPPNCSFNDLMNTVSLIFKNILQLGMAFSVIFIAYAGWLYMISGGNSSKREKATKMLTNAAIGFVIMLSAFLIVELITSTLGLENDFINLET